MKGIDKVAQELAKNLPRVYHIEMWKATVIEHTTMLDKLHELFGSDNIITEHFDTLMELYTDAVERAAGLARGTLIEIWLGGFEFNEEEYQLLIKELGE